MDRNMINKYDKGLKKNQNMIKDMIKKKTYDG